MGASPAMIHILREGSGIASIYLLLFPFPFDIWFLMYAVENPDPFLNTFHSFLKLCLASFFKMLLKYLSSVALKTLWKGQSSLSSSSVK